MSWPKSRLLPFPIRLSKVWLPALPSDRPPLRLVRKTVLACMLSCGFGGFVGGYRAVHNALSDVGEVTAILFPLLGGLAVGVVAAMGGGIWFSLIYRALFPFQDTNSS